jgi:hypothetical protein
MDKGKKATKEWGVGLLTIAWNEGTIQSPGSGPEGPSTTGGNSGDGHEPPVGAAREAGRKGGRRNAWMRISA